MGSAYPGHYNAFQKERLGWLHDGALPPITTVTTSGTYILEAYESASSGSKALKILKSTDSTSGAKTWYYLEARKAIGFDSFLATTVSTAGIATTIPNGILVHLGTESSSNSSDLLDMSPAIDTSIWDWLADAPLLVGQSFSDPAAGLTITTAWVTSPEAAVTVALGAASRVPSNPTVALSPSQSQSVQADTMVTYTVSVTNSDSSACAQSTFGLQVSAPAGWPAVFANSSLTVSPGATASTTLQVTSPAATAIGSYTIGVLGTNTSATSYTGSGAATYVISSVAPLSITVATSHAHYSPGQTVSSTDVVTSGGNPAANATVTFTITKSNGAVVTRDRDNGWDRSGRVQAADRTQGPHRRLPGQREGEERRNERDCHDQLHGAVGAGNHKITRPPTGLACETPVQTGSSVDHTAHTCETGDLKATPPVWRVPSKSLAQRWPHCRQRDCGGPRSLATTNARVEPTARSRSPWRCRSG